jgi:hypothetical protein
MMWGRVGLLKDDVSEKRIASIFRAEEPVSDTFVRNVGFYKTHMALHSSVLPRV